MNSITKRTLAIIASGLAVPALALAQPGSGGAAIGPVNDSGPQNPTMNAAQKTAVQQGQTGSIPQNAQSGMSSGSNTKQSTNVSAKTKTTTKNTSTNNTGGKR